MISFVCIYKKDDSHYLKEMIKSIPNDCELLLFETEKSNIDLINIVKQYDNIKQYSLLYKELNFSNLRNRAKSYAKNDIIFMIDADERLLIQNDELNKIIEVFENQNIGGVLVNIINFSFENNQLAKHIAPTIRIFRKKYIYENLVHETLINDINRNNANVIDSTIIIKHLGYLTDIETNFERINRNIQLMYKELSINPDNLYIEKKLKDSLLIIDEMRKLYDNNK